MNTVRLVFRIIVCVLCLMFALAFLGIEGFVLIAGEWKLYENSGIMLIQQIIKIAVCGAAGYTALMGALRPNKGGLLKGAWFFAISFIAIPFTANQIWIVFAALSALYLFTDTELWRWGSGRKQGHSVSTDIS